MGGLGKHKDSGPRTYGILRDSGPAWFSGAGGLGGLRSEIKLGNWDP